MGTDFLSNFRKILKTDNWALKEYLAHFEEVDQKTESKEMISGESIG